MRARACVDRVQVDAGARTARVNSVHRSVCADDPGAARARLLEEETLQELSPSDACGAVADSLCIFGVSALLQIPFHLDCLLDRMRVHHVPVRWLNPQGMHPDLHARTGE